MNSIRPAALAAALLLGAAWTCGAQTAGKGAANPDQAFVTEAAQGGMSEVQLGELAVKQASSKDVKAFGQMMVKDHSQDVREFQNASANLDDPQLKQCAAQLLPTVQQHLRMAQDLQAKLGGPSAPSGTIRTRSGY